ncbi:hypothetical protein [Arthrobacter monumenti]
MVALLAILLVNACVGFAIRGVDKRRSRYGLLLPSGIAVATGLLLWIILVAFGLSYTPGIYWLSWLLPMVIGTAVTITAVIVLGHRRAAADTERFSGTLQAR